MKKMANVFLSAALFSALTLGAAPAIAAIMTPGTQDLPSPPGHGFPRWYTEPGPPDASGQSLGLCLSQTPSPTGLGPMCILLADPGDPFVPTDPIVFPSNFPTEAFYFIADARILNMVGGGRADYRVALEAAFGNGPVEAGQQISFARISWRFVAPFTGIYRVTHPFGQRTFGTVGAPITAGTEIRVQDDVGIGNPGGPFAPFDTNTGTITDNLARFLVRDLGADGIPDPITIGNQVFIGDPNAEVQVTGATFLENGVPFNRFRVEVDQGSGVFSSIGNVNTFAVAGNLIGLIVSPQAGTDFGYWKPNNTSTPLSFDLQNLTANAVTPAFASDNPDFTIDPGTCTAAVAAGASCTFSATFTPSVSGTRTGNLTVSGTGVPPATVAVTGIGDGIAPTVTLNPLIRFTNQPAQLISGTATDPDVSPGPPVVPGAGVATVQVAINGGAPQLATFTAGTWEFNALGLTENADNTIDVTATDAAQGTIPGNTSAPESGVITVDTIAPTVLINEVPAEINVNSVLIGGTFNDNLSGVSVIEVSLNGVSQGTVTAFAGNDWSFTVTGLPPNAPANIAVAATDRAGNAGAPALATTSFVVLHDGDINLDGQVNIADALMTLRAAVQLITPTVEEASHGDVFPLDAVTGVPVGDGEITVADALTILRKVVGLITTF